MNIDDLKTQLKTLHDSVLSLEITTAHAGGNSAYIHAARMSLANAINQVLQHEWWAPSSIASAKEDAPAAAAPSTPSTPPPQAAPAQVASAH